jgi:hypothetical protein
VRDAIDGSEFAYLDEAHKDAIVANGVEKMMRAGVFAQKSALFLPPDVTVSDL